MRCLECGGEMVRSLDPIQSVFKGVNLTIEGVEHWRCERCGELEYESADLDVLDEAEDRAFRELNRLVSGKANESLPA